jgi:hypothetical protein
MHHYPTFCGAGQAASDPAPAGLVTAKPEQKLPGRRDRPAGQSGAYGKATKVRFSRTPTTLAGPLGVPLGLCKLVDLLSLALVNKSMRILWVLPQLCGGLLRCSPLRTRTYPQ